MSFQVHFIDTRHGDVGRRVSMANSEEEFRNTTVQELKRKLIPEDQLENTVLVTYNRNALKKNHTLGFYGIKHKDPIFAVARGSSFALACLEISSAGFETKETYIFEDIDDEELA